ncbi:MAG: tetratricopeptide repeat protein [Deltaproteobacteria bacterium]|nr:tetratricopeptide repeat protein [Deltaproteobacteria bacterium]
MVHNASRIQYEPMTSRKTNLLIIPSLFVMVFLSAIIKIGDYDIWYHIKSGEYILSTGRIIHAEPFAYTVTDRLWSVQAWLADIIFYIAYSIGSAEGLIVFNAFVITLVFFIVFKTMGLGKKDNALFFAVLLLGIALFASRFRFSARPHVFEFLILVSMVYLFEQARRTGKNRLYLIPLLQVLWVNVHASHVIGLLLPLIYLVNNMQNSSRKNLVIVFILNIVAASFNPIFLKAFYTPFVITGQKLYMANIDEWQALSLSHLWGYSLRYTWGFLTLALLGIIGFIYNRRNSDMAHVLLFGFFLLMAIRGIRLMAEFALVAAPIVFANLYNVFTRVSIGREKVFNGLALALVLLVALPVILLGRTFSFGVGVKDIFPEKAVEFIETHDIKGGMFNSFGFGDWLVWRVFPDRKGYPTRKVFIHGRNEVIPESLYRQYLDSHTRPEVWKEVAERYGVEYTLLEYYLTDLSGKEAMMHLIRNPEWTPVYWDRLAIIYVRTKGENQRLAEEMGFKYIWPTYLDFSYLDTYIKSNKTGPVIGELTRLIEISPDNEEAYLARAYLYFKMGKAWFDLSMSDVKKAIDIEPARAGTHTALGMLYLKKGDREAAKKEFKQALRLDPEEEGAGKLLKEMEGKGPGSSR